MAIIKQLGRAAGNVTKGLGIGAKNMAKTRAGKAIGAAAGTATLLGIGAAQADPVHYGINAGFDAMFDSPDIDNMILGTDLRFRDFIPSVGAIDPDTPFERIIGDEASNAMDILRPKDNPASIMSGRSINKQPFAYAQVDRNKINKSYKTAANTSYDQQSSRYPNSTFPQRMTSRQWDSATGDVVLGAYNLRRG
jgi:hypothetical protein